MYFCEINIQYTGESCDLILYRERRRFFATLSDPVVQMISKSHEATKHESADSREPCCLSWVLQSCGSCHYPIRRILPLTSLLNSHRTLFACEKYSSVYCFYVLDFHYPQRFHPIEHEVLDATLSATLLRSFVSLLG